MSVDVNQVSHCQKSYSFDFSKFEPQILANTWFAGIPEHLQHALLHNAVTKHCDKEQHLLRRGESPDGFYLVLEGALKVCSYNLNGKRAVLTFLEPGSWFGEISLFDDQPRTHDVIAHEACQLLFIPRTQFQQLLKRQPDLYPHFIALMSQRLRLLFSLVEDFTIQPLAVKLSKRLLLLANSHGIDTQEGTSIDLSLPQEALGDMLGASRQHINKELRQLEQRGVISLQYRHILITDMQQLTELAKS